MFNIPLSAMRTKSYAPSSVAPCRRDAGVAVNNLPEWLVRDAGNQGIDLASGMLDFPFGIIGMARRCTTCTDRHRGATVPKTAVITTRAHRAPLSPISHTLDRPPGPWDPRGAGRSRRGVSAVQGCSAARPVNLPCSRAGLCGPYQAVGRTWPAPPITLGPVTSSPFLPARDSAVPTRLPVSVRRAPASARGTAPRSTVGTGDAGARCDRACRRADGRRRSTPAEPGPGRRETVA